jgi:hypothetical protein
MDIFGEDADGTPVVVELKRRRVGPAAVSQLGRYVDAVRRELGGEGDGADGDGADGDGAGGDVAVRGVLVAPSVTERAEGLLDEAGFEFVAVELE